MRDNLIGYLLEALEPSEHQAVKQQLERDPQLREELKVLERSLTPLTADEGHYEPPAGLAQRTCAYVANCVTSLAHAEVFSSTAHSPSRWRMADFVVAAGIVFAASMLCFSAVNQSRFRAHVLGCQNNLRQLGMALTQYSSRHGNMFPNVALRGKTGVAGIYAPKLVNNGYLLNSGALICPGSASAVDAASFHVPTVEEVERADRARLAELHRKMGGSYAYNIGYMQDGQYKTTKNAHRESFALMADAPIDDALPKASGNHGAFGQNVLFEDGHVAHLTSCKAGACGDNIYLNDDGEVAPGLHSNDAVLGSSFVRPVRLPAGN